MSMLKKFILFSLIIGFGFYFGVPLPAHADSGINLTTSPLPVNLSANPGQTVTTNLRIQNSSNTTQRIKVSLMKFSAYGENGKPALQNRAPGDDYFDWAS